MTSAPRLRLVPQKSTIIADPSGSVQQGSVMEVKETVTAAEWSRRPRRARGMSRVVQQIISAVEKAQPGYWVVVDLADRDKKRQPTIRSQISAAAAQKSVQVSFEMRAGDLGVRRVG